MPDELFRWSKSVDDCDLEWWETELTAGGYGYAVEKSVGWKSWRLSVWETGRPAAEAIRERYGGSVIRVRPEDWQHQDDEKGAPLRIRNRLIVTRRSDSAGLKTLASEFPGREILSFPARLAFGTGGHPTTATCLRMLVDATERFDGSGWSILDLGCGSGILSVAAAKLGASKVTALELDSIALDVAGENVRRHEVSESIHLLNADAVEWAAHPPANAIPVGGFDIVVANLFSDLLISIFPALPSLMALEGVFIISGFLTSQAKAVSEAAAAAGLHLDQFIRRGRWVTASGRPV